ncbi:hypothetical protein HA402_010867 [Bradysia odoriphaga]|nr:hypothetical protein HA402_010867 [Bradysia odoriphaga]
MTTTFYGLVFVLFTLADTQLAYEIPPPYVEVLTKGFRVSIPDEPGITLFGFHGNINKRFYGNEEGDLRQDVLRARNGVWAYENRNRQVMEGDILYFWVYVQHESLGYVLDDQEFRFTFRRTTTSRTTTTRPTTRTTQRTTRTTPTPVTRGTTSSWETTQSTTTPIVRPDYGGDGLDCQPSITTVRGKPVCRNEVIFEEHFSGTGLSKSWKNGVKMPLDTEDAEFVSYQNLPSICYVRDGYFNIFPKILSDMPGFTTDSIRSGTLDFSDRCTAVVDTRAECSRTAQHFTILPPVVSCKIKTKQTFTFKYGRVEIRAKLPKGDWLFPQLSLEPIGNDYGTSGFNSGLLRVAFIRGNENLKTKNDEPIDGRKLSGGAVLVSREKFRDLWMRSKFNEHHYGDDFHTYELRWTNKSIELGVDGVTYGTIEGGFRDLARTNNVSVSAQLYAGEYMAPFDKEFFLSIGVGVGGISDFPDASRNGYGNFVKPWTNTSPKAELHFWNDVEQWNSTWNRQNSGLQVDYVKVWSI